MWKKRFAVTCDILFQWLVVSQAVTGLNAVMHPDVRFRGAASCLSNRDTANDEIRGLFAQLGHNHQAQWGTEDLVPVMKKTPLLSKRKRNSVQVLPYGNDHKDAAELLEM
ncbi:hypothetical protein E8E13_004958 [Curvularia kusanoi]|uniref:Uncharacterized protein n=1 Tax=Curvularia kusanoi TaxID=90978 RepID=A0A9P4TH66_CURKU|nr:hypothetical protein E8E13_004958 [Curvularia kusanoi]